MAISISALIDGQSRNVACENPAHFLRGDGAFVALPGGSLAWGSVTGILADQVDLQTALDAKAAGGHTHAGVYEPANANIQSHIAQAHAPSNAQANADITKAEIEAKLTGQIGSHTHAGGSEAFPVGSVFIAVVSTNPATLLGYGTWSVFGAGKVLVGLDATDPDFDTAEETGGAKTVTLDTTTIPAHTHIQDAHNHTQNSHNHTQDAHGHGVTDPTHNHTQNSHTHIITSQTATTGSATSYEHGTLDTSSAEAEATEVTGATTATNNAVATGLTVSNATATNQAATATNQVATATNQNTGGGLAHNNVQPYIVCYFWKRTL